MDFADYQADSKKTAIYPNIGQNFVYPAFGLMGEAGEIADVAKRIVRDKGGIYDQADRTKIQNELGDVLWYVAQLASEFQLSLKEIAEYNIQKLLQRKKMNALRNHPRSA